MHPTNTLPYYQISTAMLVELPAFLDPAAISPYITLLLTIMAFSFMIMGGEWLSDGISTAALALRYPPIFVGLVITSVLGVIPQVIFLATISAADLPHTALGGLLGGTLLAVFIPVTYAGLKNSIPKRPRWAKWDIPLLVTYLIIFTFLCLDGGLNQLEGIGLLTLGVGYLIFRYYYGVQRRYGMTTFGAEFVFGISPLNMTLKSLVGAFIILGCSIYLSVVFTHLVGHLGLPAFPLGMLSMIPFCFPEISFAMASIKRGHGELILGQGLCAATLLLLFGGGILALWELPIPAEMVNFPHLSLIGMLLILWVLLRTSRRLWKWQSTLLLLLTIACLVVTWAQSYGLCMNLSLPVPQ